MEVLAYYWLAFSLLPFVGAITLHLNSSLAIVATTKSNPFLHK
jgi:hypothetical protein